MKNIELLTDAEIMALPVGSVFIFDVETYRNFVCVCFRELKSGKHVILQMSPVESLNTLKLSHMLWNFCLVGFNSDDYDMPIVTLILNMRTVEEIKQASDDIILRAMRPKDFEKTYNVKIPNTNRIDLIEVAPLQASLKLYGGRLHCPVMQDLPYDPHAELSQGQAADVVEYCCNDLANTALLLLELFPHIELRVNLGKEYGRDMRSLSDAQVAEAIIGVEMHKATGHYPYKPKTKAGQIINYNVPSYMKFQTPIFQRALDTVARARFMVQENGSCDMPQEIAELKLGLGTSVYKMGIGGLHSTEKEAAYTADENTLLIDRDVASYYPKIILNQELYPDHLGRTFLEVYNNIVNRRLAAKKAGEKKISEGLKIAINGIFGKFGNQYSIVYSPNLLLQVTLSGQLFLLMLIEMIELAGIPVVSGNTDGVVIRCPKTRYDDLQAIVKVWEQQTGFETEETQYKAIYSRDVNNYIAVKKDNSCKTKGTYCERGSAQNSVLSKNPEALICSDAVQALLTSNTPIAQTIRANKDIKRFVSVRNVKGGAHKDGIYLGRSIRWYYARGVVGTINYRTTGNKVPKTDGAKPLMTLPADFPADVDYDYYIREANEMLYDIGYKQRAASLKFF